METKQKSQSSGGEKRTSREYPKRPAVLLAPKLQKFYESHNVVGIDELLSSGSAHDKAMHRFVRLNPRFCKEDTLQMLRSELEPHKSTPIPVPWLHEGLEFYAVPGDFALAQSEVYRSGRIYGMDVSSGAAVAALLSANHDCDGGASDNLEGCKSTVDETFRVLDLCCSPGLKLCAIADFLSTRQKTSTVVGVDVSEKRIALCKNIVKKYHIDSETSGQGQMRQSMKMQDVDASRDRVRIRLYHNDGTTFGQRAVNNLVFDSVVAKEQCLHAGKRKRMNKSARARERKRLRQLEEAETTRSSQSEAAQGTMSIASAAALKDDDIDTLHGTINVKLFDRVLVDAECSTDGSIKHVLEGIKKADLSNADGTGGGRKGSGVSLAENPLVTDSSELQKIVCLQRRLVDSGLRLLKPGGILVYATCSLSQEQNEDVVTWLLQKYPEDVSVVPVDFSSLSKREQDKYQSNMISGGSLPGTVRFLPLTPCSASEGDQDSCLFGGGFFLAKLIKRMSHDNELLCGKV